MKSGHGFVLVYSITSQATFNDLTNYYERIMNVKENDRNVRRKEQQISREASLIEQWVSIRDHQRWLSWEIKPI